MRRFPFDDHTAPTLKTVLAFCHNTITYTPLTRLLHASYTAFTRLQMRRFPFDDHTAPTLKTVLAFCHNATTFLKEDQENVIAVHCKGGKGRTGVMMACLLMWTGHRATALDAIELHAFRRSAKYEMCSPHNQTPTGPAQVRYAHYLEAILYNDLNPASEPVLLPKS
jgi:hypothetical protein